jgi:hypothetical protein
MGTPRYPQIARGKMSDASLDMSSRAEHLILSAIR